MIHNPPLASQPPSSLLQEAGNRSSAEQLEEPMDTSEFPETLVEHQPPAPDDTLPSSSSNVVDIHRLEDIPSEEVIQDLKIHQLKAILEKFQVDIEGCCEKKDLADQVTLLWRTRETSRNVDLDTANISGSFLAEHHRFSSADNQRQDQPTSPESIVNDESNLSQPSNGENSDSYDTCCKESRPHIILAGEVPTLTSFTSKDDIGALSIRQLKAILQKNSVDYSLCREREELAALVKHLWEDAHKWSKYNFINLLVTLPFR